MARGVTVGADGLNSAAVSRVTKEAAERAGLNPSGYSAHSLRAGFVSECDRRHIPNGAVRAVTRHTSDAGSKNREHASRSWDRYRCDCWNDHQPGEPLARLREIILQGPPAPTSRGPETWTNNGLGSSPWSSLLASSPRFVLLRYAGVALTRRLTSVNCRMTWRSRTGDNA